MDIEEVKRLHQRLVLEGGWKILSWIDPSMINWREAGYCGECRVTWPCRTAKALGEDND